MCNYHYLIISDVQKQQHQKAQTNVLTEIRTVVNFGSREGRLVVRKRHDGDSDNILFLDLGRGYRGVYSVKIQCVCNL